MKRPKSTSTFLANPRRAAGAFTAAVMGLAVVAALAVAPLPTPVAAATTTTTVTATADTYVDSAKPSSTFGSRTTINADGSPAQVLLLRFPVPAGTATITRATLRLLVGASSSDGLTVDVTTSGWSESQVTWRTAPASGGRIASVDAVTSGQWTNLDVTSAVLAGAQLDLRVSTPGARRVAISAREAGLASAPSLVLEHAPAPTPSSTPTTSPSSTPTTSPSSTPTQTAPTQPTYPIRAAFYYPWFPEAWSQSGISPFTHYRPTAGYYDGRSPAVIEAQVADMLYAGMDAGIASWWGRGSKEDTRIPLLLDAAAGTPFRWTLYHEMESKGDPSSSEISADLAHIADRFAGDPSYLRIDGRPVLFVYADSSDGCGMVDRWTAANTRGFHLVLKVFSGYTACGNQPQGWHQYGPAAARQAHGTASFVVSPGFWLRTDSQPRLVRDPARFEADVAAMASSGAKLQLVTTFNEWGEGTSVESADQWSSASGRGTYLDILHRWLADAGAGVTASPSGSATTPVPTGTATTAAPTTPPPTSPPPTSPAPSTSSTSHAKVIVVGDVQVFESRLDENLATSNLALAESGVDLILNNGDAVDDGTLTSLQNTTWGWPAHWGRSWLWDKLRIVPGNHDYLVSNATDFKAYFGDRTGPAGTFYRSFDIAGWHIIQMNSNISMSAGSAQYSWLAGDLAANAAKPTIVQWHEPRFSSGRYTDSTRVSDAWKLLDDHRQVEIVFSGHDHTYQRYTRVLDDGSANESAGIVQWISSAVSGNRAVPTDRPILKAKNTTQEQLGILVLDLYPDRYEWRFEATADSVPDLNDTGSQLVRVPAA